MARLARIVSPHTPHLITQRGNRGLDVFFEESDALAYIDFMAEQCQRFDVQIWAYCLMRNRVHFLAVPADENGLARALGETHRRYTNRINERKGENGHLWQSRFSSFPMDDDFVLPAAHFIEMTPVMAGMAKTPDAFRWSSARAHLKGEDDALCSVAPLLSRSGDWESFLQKGINIGHAQKIMAHIKTGRPLGSTSFIEALEELTGRNLKKKKPGRKPMQKTQEGTQANMQRRRRLLHPDALKETSEISEKDLAAWIENSMKNAG